jgi:hypothetical protein
MAFAEPALTPPTLKPLARAKHKATAGRVLTESTLKLSAQANNSSSVDPALLSASTSKVDTIILLI